MIVKTQDYTPLIKVILFPFFLLLINIAQHHTKQEGSLFLYNKVHTPPSHQLSSLAAKDVFYIMDNALLLIRDLIVLLIFQK